MPKKVLHIVETSGGVERYLINLLKKIQKYPEFEHILVCSTLLNTDKFDHLVSDICIVDSMRHPISFRNDLKAVLAVRKAIRKYKPDIVYCHSSKAGAIGRTADLFIRNRLIYNAHGWSFNMKYITDDRRRLYTFVERALAPVTDKIVCISEYEKNSAIEYKICGPDKLTVINNGIDFDEYSNLHLKSREDLGIPENAFVVGMIGRLTLQKAPDVFVKMAQIVKDRIPEAFFLLVGDDLGGGSCRNKTEKQIAESGLEDSFRITGWVDDPLDYMGVFDVAAVLSRWEGFGLVLPEYMYMGKPIVATKVDAIPYVVGDSALMIDTDDERQAADAVIRLHDDQELRGKMIRLGKERVKLFDAQITADKHAVLFRQDRFRP